MSWIPDAIVSANPDKQITVDVVVRKGMEWIFKGRGVRNVFTIDKKNKMSELWQTLKKIRREKYDIVINYHRYGSSAFLSLLSGGEKKATFDSSYFSFFYDRVERHGIGDGRHEVERNHALTNSLVRCLPFTWRGPRNIQRRIVVAPCSRLPTKTLIPAQWHLLIKGVALSFPKFSISVVGGPEDEKYIEKIRGAGSYPANVEWVPCQTPFEKSAELIKNAFLFIGVDSAPLHIASLYNVPSVVVYCSTVPALGFGPLSSSYLIIETEYPLRCRPCGITGKQKCPAGHFMCALSINLMNALKKITSFGKLLVEV